MPEGGGRYATQQVAGAPFDPSTPTTVAGLKAWYDLSDTATITNAGGGAVSDVLDKSGNANHLTQATAGKRPTTGIRTIGGRNVLDFDGGDALSDSTFAFAVNAFSCYAVFAADVSGSSERIVSLAQAGSNDWNTASGVAVLILAGAATYWGNAVMVSGATFDTSPVQYSIFRATGGDSFSGRKNRVAITGSSGVGSASFSPNRLTLGAHANAEADSLFNGGLGEVILYSAANSSTDRDTIETYLKAKWGTP